MQVTMSLTSLNTVGKRSQFNATLQHLSSQFLVSLPLSASGLVRHAIFFPGHAHFSIGACDPYLNYL